MSFSLLSLGLTLGLLMHGYILSTWWLVLVVSVVISILWICLKLWLNNENNLIWLLLGNKKLLIV